MRYYQTCRFCHKASFETPKEGMVRYSTRHWMHYTCGLEHFGVIEFLAKLQPHQIATIPNGIVEGNPFLRTKMLEFAAQ